ncbi:MAG: A/G-specific adenine glycosylase [Ardenticatenaceae bacterium]|nr:A/G-specific adenine glycosylase [Ardenticatenaceae bacterium]
MTSKIADKLLDWWDDGHADLPWRGLRDPYPIWISEIMAQQTQLVTVIPYYERWMARFPSVEALAAAPLDDVLKMWEGLGYYSRARNLHAAAQAVVNEYGGKIPQTAAELQQLKGIGRYTAGAIASICFDEPVPVLDGNVMRVLSRLDDMADDVTSAATKKQLWTRAAELVPVERPGEYNQALMELGQTICTPKSPKCLLCPLLSLCKARKAGTQHERPVKPPRKKTPHYDVVAGVIWQQKIGDGHFLIAQRPLDGLLGGLWEFPGGKVENGESLPDALIREIKEELAIDIIVPQMRPFTIVKHAYTHFRITLHAYHALYQNGEVTHLEVNDHAWVDINRVENFAFAVTDRKIIQQLVISH